MNRLRFEPSQQIELIHADADIAINGWDQPSIELVLDGELDQCTAEQAHNTLSLTSHAALALHIPAVTAVHVQQIFGDLLLRDLDGEIAVDNAHGDISIRGGTAEISVQEAHGSLTAMRGTGSITADLVHGDVQLVEMAGGQLNHVHGDLHARSIAGDLELGDVSGDIGVRNLGGSFRLERGHGRLQAYDLHGGLQASHLAGDLSLKTVLDPGQVYRARTQGDIRARFPADTSAHFDLSSNGTVSARLPTVERQEPTRVIGQTGKGEAKVILQAEGDLWVYIQGQDKDTFDAWQTIDSISTQIEAEIAQHLGKMSVDANTQRQIDQAIRQADQELAQAQRRLEQETQRAQERARRVQEKAAKAAKRAQERIARASRSWGVTIDTGSSLFGPPLPQDHPSAKSSPISGEEQLAILKMLQEKKISVEEAERLLEALEG